MRRQRIRTPLKTGVRVIDFFTPLCAGQRIGIFAGSGIGKSTLLAMLARSRGFDTAVIALVGERGREVREFMEDVMRQDRKPTIIRACIDAGDVAAAAAALGRPHRVEGVVVHGDRRGRDLGFPTANIASAP